MAVKIRLKRMGKKNTPFYRLVVVDSRWRRDGKTIADVGWYDPVKQPAQTSLQEKEIYRWLSNGAQVSETARSLLKKAGIWDRFRTGEYKSLPESPEVVRTDLTVGEGKKEVPQAAASTPPEEPATGTPSE